MIFDVLKETLTRLFWIAIIVIPLLLIVEWLNHKYGDKLIAFFEKRKKFMPFWSALLALLPGCNVAAAVALLYAKRLVSMGTLIASMIATSDEAIYVFIPMKFNFLPLYATKFIFAVIIGFLVDIFAKQIKSRFKLQGFEVGYCCSIHEHVHTTKDMLFHATRHAVKILFFVFIVLFGFNLIKDYYSFSELAKPISITGNFQPFFAGVVGLIPGCGTSVVLATLYTQGLLTFGGAVTGLSVAAGDTILVLIANKIPKKELATIITITFITMVTAGYLVNYLLSFFR